MSKRAKELKTIPVFKLAKERDRPRRRSDEVTSQASSLS
jgi:hypothetical protein